MCNSDIYHRCQLTRKMRADQNSHRIITELLLPPVDVLPVGHLHRFHNDECDDHADYNGNVYNDDNCAY